MSEIEEDDLFLEDEDPSEADGPMDLTVIQPYQFEPEAEADGALDDTDEEDDIDVEGRAGNSDWCSCGNICRSMTCDEESRCCHENNHVRIVKTPDYNCVTQNPSFNRLILDRELLSMVRHGLALKTKSQRKRRLLIADVPQNRTWRYAAYKQFTSWINSWTTIGFKNRIVLPSCVIWKIRDEFPEEDGNYTGFKSAVGGGGQPE